LTFEQKQSGAVVIDLGGGTTDYLVYSGGLPSAAGVIAVGGDHITNDIAHGFNMPVSQAEKLKCEYGCAILDLETASQKVSLEAEGGFPSKTINIKSLHTVINARADELLVMIKQRLEEEGVLQHIGSGVVLTGGGAKLDKIADLAERTFRMPCSIGVPRNVSGVTAVTEGPEYATCSGLVQYGFQTMDDNDMASPMEWLRNIFSR
jgi:cell division protein FtsA